MYIYIFLKRFRHTHVSLYMKAWEKIVEPCEIFVSLGNY